MRETNKLPKSDFSRSVGEEVVIFIADADQLEPMNLPIESGRISGRLVGVDRPGVWLEPKSWYDEAMEKGEAVSHVFLKWDNVLGLTRPIDNSKFEHKKEYRGLRPRP